MYLRLPKAILGVGHEIARHLLRRPVVGVTAVCRDERERILLVRRADTGTWGLPGGTLEWGETLLRALARELEEEAGVTDFTLARTLGVWSRPDRDPRFHAVTVGVLCSVREPARAPQNPLEIREVRFFEERELPSPLAMSADDLVAAARGPFVLE